MRRGAKLINTEKTINKIIRVVIETGTLTGTHMSARMNGAPNMISACSQRSHCYSDFMRSPAGTFHYLQHKRLMISFVAVGDAILRYSVSRLFLGDTLYHHLTHNSVSIYIITKLYAVPRRLLFGDPCWFVPHRYANTFLANLVSRAFRDSSHQNATIQPLSIELRNTTSETVANSRTQDAVLAVATVRGLERHISDTDGMHNHEMKKTPLDLIEVRGPS